MRRYLRKVDGSIVCREDGERVTSRGAHEAQWHSLSPRPSRDALNCDSRAIPSTWAPPAERGWAYGPLDIELRRQA